jgi:hypothetical protein
MPRTRERREREREKRMAKKERDEIVMQRCAGSRGCLWFNAWMRKDNVRLPLQEVECKNLALHRETEKTLELLSAPHQSAAGEASRMAKRERERARERDRERERRDREIERETHGQERERERESYAVLCRESRVPVVQCVDAQGQCALAPPRS